MNRKCLFLLFVLFLFTAFQANAQKEQLLVNDTIVKIMRYIDKNYCDYMVDDSLKLVLDMPGWEKDSLIEYSYHSIDFNGETLTSKVILYNPNSLRAANWIYSSFIDCKIHYTFDRAKAIVNQINNASGFQFVVRGVVYEDEYDSSKGCGAGHDKAIESFIFFDGVTVTHNNISFTICKHTGPRKHPNSNQLEMLMRMKETDIRSALVFARICSTTREQAIKYEKEINAQTLDLDKLKFIPYVRSQYHMAMHSRSNSLINAWVYDRFK